MFIVILVSIRASLGQLYYSYARIFWLECVVRPHLIVRNSAYPMRLLLRLINPFPLRFSTPTPLSPDKILEDPRIVEHRMKEFGLPSVRTIWPFYLRDTPLSCLYRMYEWGAADVSVQVGYETEYFWYHTAWKVEDIPDPQDPDPVRYAVLAGFAEVMALAFNERIDMGILRVGFHLETSTARKFRTTLSREEFESYTASQHERPPAWTTCAQGPSALFTFRNGSGHTSQHFTKRNVEICGAPDMFWI